MIYVTERQAQAITEFMEEYPSEDAYLLTISPDEDGRTTRMMPMGQRICITTEHHSADIEINGDLTERGGIHLDGPT